MVMKQLHEGAKWQFRVSAFFGWLFFLVFFSFWITGFIVAWSGVQDFFSIFAGYILVFIVFLIVLTEVFARLSYKFWKYEFTNDQLRIERGIIWKRYSNIPYQRMQNIDITRGVIARILGFSTVNIQTAGYSMSANGMNGARFSEGYIPAVSIAEAEKIREFVIKKITKKKGQGL
jgi:membrane protein YdbS with pleckstrin-like domain